MSINIFSPNSVFEYRASKPNKMLKKSSNNFPFYQRFGSEKKEYFYTRVQSKVS